MEDSSGKGKWTNLLKSVEFFKPFTVDDLDDILKTATVKKFEPRECIIRAENEDDSFFVILRGSAHIIVEDKQKFKHTIGTISEGDCFGEMAILLKEPRSASIYAAANCFVFEIAGKNIDDLELATMAKLYRQFAFFLARRLKRSSKTK